jgi:LPXTG-motif cell wall-anchored protein
MRWLRGSSALFACLALTGADVAAASPGSVSPPECEAQLSRAPDGEQAALCLSGLAWLPGPFQERAGRRLEQLAEEHPDIPWFGFQLARLRHQPAPREAELLYRQSIAVAARRGLARAEVYARTGLARLLREQGRREELGAEIDQALKVAHDSKDPKALTKAVVAQASYLQFLGELEQAYVKLTGLGATEDESLQRDYLFALFNITQQTGRFKETRGALRGLLALGEKSGDAGLIAKAGAGLATTRKEELSELPNAKGREEVLGLVRQALETARAAKSPALEVNALWMIGSLSADPTEAIGHLERCMEVASTTQLRCYCQAALARRLAPTDPEAAEDAIDEALRLSQKAGDALSWVASWHERMRMSWALGPDRGLRDSRAALDAIEALRDLQRGSSGQPSVFSTWAEDYYWFSGRLLEMGRQEDAFGVIERMRARTLTDALGLPRPDVPPDLHARRAEVALAITRLQRRLMGEGLSAADREAARSKLGRLETEADGIRLQIQQSDPALAGPRHPGFASLEQVRRNLGRDEALLSFQVAPWKDLAGDFGGGSWLLASTRAGTRTYQLADRTELRPNIETFNGMFAARDGLEAETSAVLYSKLMQEALAQLPREIRKLVIVPDDALHRLPFAALRPEPDKEPLATRFQISLVPSATLWLRWRNEKTPMSGEPALVFADPPAGGEGPAKARAAAFGDRASLGALPLARDEGRSVVDHLGGGSLLLVGEEASEARLKSAGTQGFRIVHFATHSWTDDVAPERSYVYLAPGSLDQDGLLQPPEIAELPLRGRMVVLSTCESAGGEILRGEGVMGLARSFFLSGAHPVVASLWKLRDDDGAALFDRFYAHLAEGRSVAAALQAAQRDRIEAGAPAFAWAGVVVLGDGDRVPMPGGRKTPVLPALGLVALLLAAGAYFLRKRRTRVHPARGRNGPRRDGDDP